MSAAPTSLASTLADELHKSRRTAYRKYAELLAAADTSPVDGGATDGAAAAAAAAPALDAKATAQLRTLAATLGRSPADVESDVRVLRAAASRRARIARARGSYAAQVAAKAALDAYDAETARLLAERRDGYRALYAAYASHGRRNTAGRDAVAALNALIHHHPELLADVERPTDHDLA